jgi:hypothetical protein
MINIHEIATFNSLSNSIYCALISYHGALGSVVNEVIIIIFSGTETQRLLVHEGF